MSFTSLNQNSVHSKLGDSMSHPFFIFIIWSYEFSRPSFHESFIWDLICSIADQSALPWCIFGDSNDLLSSDEKIGNRDHPNWLIQDFCEVISDCNLHDLPIEDYTYTWARRKRKFVANTKDNKFLLGCLFESHNILRHS